ncbi:hypothetical protein ORL23_09585 [Kluyvera cryocrescens]|uniref:hypothetical protein n=1 Tax=Kluyvera cryocrescens TaxID=580 RepID=UPI00224AF9FE|nr:hypothetical protein [Kluyvera cryocrescens]MCX2867733.1 hypothetical protein [Kluyvera cryocrescens]
MSKINNAIKYSALVFTAASFLLSVYLIFSRHPYDGMTVNCSTILSLAHKNPDVSSVVDLTLRLHSNHTGQVALSGSIKQDNTTRTISRAVHFDYEIKNPGELLIENMRYEKNQKDSATDDDFKMNFFYVPDGKQRLIKINPLQNAYLIENPHSPVFLCVNKET